jgi:hypothetical protein
MLFLREFYNPDEYVESVLVENKQSGEKDVIVKGIYAQANVKNRNGRIYPEEYMDRELYKLQKQIAENRLTGELDHPKEPEVKLANAAFKIVSLKKDGSNYIGEGKIMKDVPRGQIAYGLAKEGVKFGASTRALGSLKESKGANYVQNDLNWLTIDLVADPSAPEAFVDSIMEQTEYFFDGEKYVVDKIKTYKKQLDEAVKNEHSKKAINEKVTNLFEDFISTI